MIYDLLSEPVRKFIYNKGWEQLRPIQVAAIEKISTTDNNYILASRTASGKTEAAFLPILSKVDFRPPGIHVLYISPLIALINDQFIRMEELCKYLDIEVTRWHGEANKTLKDRIVENPNGMILITPESLEAMFVNKPYYVKQLFSDLKYVVIDEIHSFLGSDRGTQLKSILFRLQQINKVPFAIVGLSATIGDYSEAKKFTGDESNTKVLLDRSAKPITASFRYFSNEGEELPAELMKDLYKETKDEKVLIFPNSRGKAEEVAVKLKKMAERLKGHSNYFSHHSSVDKEVREYVENFAKNNKRQNFCISCTSTLELGIDIGTVDEVIQIDATSSVASLIQRVGRSGRQDGQSGKLELYATNKWSLLQSLACWLLYEEGFVEPPLKNFRSYDIFLHQALSVTKSTGGIKQAELVRQMKNNFAFSDIETGEMEEIIAHLLAIDMLEQVGQELIIGLEGERVVNGRDFYSVFKTEDNLKVVNAGRVIGEIPFSPQLKEDENILLAARMWKIKFIDIEAKKVEVMPAKDGKKPVFYGSGAPVDPKIRQKMIEIVYSDLVCDVLDPSSIEELNEIRKEFSGFKLEDLQRDRPLINKDASLILYTFTGTRMNRTIHLLLNLAGIKNYFDDSSSSFEIAMDQKDFLKKWSTITEPVNKVDEHLADIVNANPSILDFSKWGAYLPTRYKVELLKQKYFDFANAELIRSLNPVAATTD